MRTLSQSEVNNLKYGRTAVGNAMDLFSTLGSNSSSRANDFIALKNMKPVSQIKISEETKELEK